ncbi:hypothetical protein CEXT_777141 [Caerostris extrusa]|uniref:Uncharacterized protein n=1 Tax=Caerostris extrusa TaxID=172846 RepID=A0AAV4V561_CAEEX|nr:hypothetical protein CEXT_777141 [Caerostris extrusa]
MLDKTTISSSETPSSSSAYDLTTEKLESPKESTDMTTHIMKLKKWVPQLKKSQQKNQIKMIVTTESVIETSSIKLTGS